ncbi:hypothetical protein HPB48_001906 [Haemaphysalis longicornis]|uniref:Uncharacterized protein n=1 Tax=Haemaphysalis longicornis TaxID=44386 RepID=A0A9J6G487_HAELO|nr:hypothetical protein HPB48_001906 [Haemaphysalis longicornis]
MLRNKDSLTTAEAAKFMARVGNVENLALLLYLDSNISKQLQRISSIDLEDRLCHVTTYPASPLNTCKGVVHNIPAGTGPDHLMRHLSTLLEATRIFAARMMGHTATAIITFQSTHMPREICCASGIFRCRPHLSKAQYCHRSQKTGYPADVCTCKHHCLNCGQVLPEDARHTCSADSVCLRCGSPHRADHATCSDTGKAREKPFASQHTAKASLSALMQWQLMHQPLPLRYCASHRAAVAPGSPCPLGASLARLHVFLQTLRNDSPAVHHSRNQAA